MGKAWERKEGRAISSVRGACEPAAVVVDPRKGPRRRGDVLYAAIFDVTLEK